MRVGFRSVFGKLMGRVGDGKLIGVNVQKEAPLAASNRGFESGNYSPEERKLRKLWLEGYKLTHGCQERYRYEGRCGVGKYKSGTFFPGRENSFRDRALA